MKTVWTEKDIAFKSEDPKELLEIGLQYLDSPVPGLRNELEKQIQRCKNNGAQKGKKSHFIAIYDLLRKEYCLVIKDEYEPQCLLALLFELLTETEFKGTLEEEMAVRRNQIEGYLNLIAKNEEIDLNEQIAFLEDRVGELLQMLYFYQDDDSMSDEQLERLSEKFDSLYFEPINNTIEFIMKSIVSGNMECDVDTGNYPLPNSDEMA